MTDTRVRILDAARELLAEAGLSAFTLDAVARRAGVSKGGVFYHFASKEVLVSGLVDRYIQLFETRLHETLAREPAGPGRFARALIRTTLDDAGVHNGYKRAILQVAMASPDVLQPLREYSRRALDNLMQDGLDDGLAEIVCFAADGLWFGEMLDLVRFSSERRRQLARRLLALTECDAADAAGQVR